MNIFCTKTRVVIHSYKTVYMQQAYYNILNFLLLNSYDSYKDYH